MNNPRVLLGAILVIIGVSILFDINLFRFVIPALLIVVGWRLINGRSEVGSVGNPKIERVSSEEISDVHVFSSHERVVESAAFEGGKYVALFSGGILDLREVTLNETDKVELEVISLLSNVTLRIPESWRIKSDIVAIIGGFENKSSLNSEKVITLHIRGASILGSIEISN